jgi:hypothetical protein
MIVDFFGHIGRRHRRPMMNAGLPYSALPIHPTVSELIPTMLGEMEAISRTENLLAVWLARGLRARDPLTASPTIAST